MKSSAPRTPLGRALAVVSSLALLALASSSFAAGNIAAPDFCAVPPAGAFTPGTNQQSWVSLHDQLTDTGRAAARRNEVRNSLFSGRRSPLKLVARDFKGSFRVLVLPVQFTDIAATTSTADLGNLFFSKGGSTNSLRNFYLENSYGKVDLDGQVVTDPQSATGYLRLPHTYSYYSGGNYGQGTPPNDATQMVQDALAAAVRANPNLDWRTFDSDGDGVIDFLAVVHAGQGAEGSGDAETIWSHWTMLPENTITRSNMSAGADALITLKRLGAPYDTIRVRGGAGAEYSISATSYVTVSEELQINTLAHELGHAMGLPDLYGASSSHEGPGFWSLMAGGGLLPSPSHMDAWSKMKLGWLTPVNVSSTAAGLQLPSSERSPAALKVPADPLRPDEYFLLENRNNGDLDPTSFDAYLPNSGVLIYHVDESVSGNDNVNHLMLRVEEADGQYNLLNSRSFPFPLANLGDPMDVWPTWSKMPDKAWFGLDPSREMYSFYANPDARTKFGLGPAPTTPLPARDKDTFGPATQPRSINYSGRDSGVTIKVGQPGTTTQVDVTLTTGPAKVTLSGTLTTPDGSPLPSLNLGLVDEAGEQLPNQATFKGTGFTFADLPPGKYTLFVSSQGWVPQSQPVDLTRANGQVSMLLLRQPVFPQGWNLVSVPLDFHGLKASQVFGDAQVKALSYSGGGYVQDPVLRPGVGFFLFEAQPGQHQIQQAGQPVDLSSSVANTIQPGWNMLGNPYALPLVWNPARFTLMSSAGTASMKAAKASGSSTDVAWAFSNPLNKFVQVSTAPGSNTLAPWTGYWYSTKLTGALLSPPPVPPSPQ